MSGLKTGMENDMFWSVIGSGFDEPGGTPPPRIPRSTRPGRRLLDPTQPLFVSSCNTPSQ